MKLTVKLNLVKLIILIAFMHLLLYYVSSNKAEEMYKMGLLYADADGWIEFLFANQEDLMERIMYFAYKCNNLIIGVLFTGVGIDTFILLTDCFQSRFFYFILGLVKLLTVSIISSLACIGKSFSLNNGPQLNTYVPQSNTIQSNTIKSQSNNVGNNLVKSNISTNGLNNQGNVSSQYYYNYRVPRFAISSILSCILAVGIGIAEFSFSKFPFNLFSLFFVLVGLVALFGYPNKYAIFKKCKKMVKKGMCIAEVENIMRRFSVYLSEYRGKYFVLHYRLKEILGDDYENVIFYFLDGKLVDEDESYRRTTVRYN